MDSLLHLVPGRYKLPTAPGGSLRKDGPGWEKAENKFTATSGLLACVCVCVLCRLHICTCVFQCVVCAIKKPDKGLNYYYYYLFMCVYARVCVCVCVCVCVAGGDARSKSGDDGAISVLARSGWSKSVHFK